MKKSFWSVLSFIFILQNGFSQDKISPILQESIDEHPKVWQEIVVVGSERVDAFQWAEIHKNQYTNRHDFTVAFLKHLKAHSQQNQQWLDELKEEKLPFEIQHTFWSVNMVAISAPAKTIQYLKENPDVFWMEKISERMVSGIDPIEIETGSQRSINGSEPGILAIKADSLWKLGYTGRGSKLLTFDTGIWPNHPSLGDRFLGYHVPLYQAWYGYDTYYPGDKVNSHGTHVTGTCLGLDPANSDTIGLAFNAYFMATDPIVSNVADIKSTYDILRGYEWSLNPDGDLNTTNDMPDVINNSWGRTYDPMDSAVCDGWINDLFVNLEIAGIISIHSAGNSGPGAQTVGFPALGNASPVNNFAVGAVSGTDPSFPIASFSSRGPTPCGDTGTLAIKPEVVAPGVNVRSSIREANGNYSFANYQGTSMAAPHVSGVALLLREAFPEATATEIKEAIFYTAMDLGDLGEDNTYGNGMIDAVAAFGYLSNLYSPHVPMVDTFDLSITGFDIEPYQAVCDLKRLKVYMKNSRPINSGELYFIYGFETGSQVYSTVGTTFASSDTHELNVSKFFTFETGWNEFHVRLAQNVLSPSPEADTINNARFIRFWVNGQEDLPFQENFDSVHVFESSMYVGNPDERKTWDTAVVEGKYGVSNAAKMNFADYSPRQYQHDYLQTPNLQIGTTNSLMLTFDVSYQVRFNGFADSLMVKVSTDCGETWSAPVYAKGPDSLNTTTISYTQPWFPQSSTDWRTEIVDLSAYANQSQIMVRLESSNGQGNNLFVDNINVFGDSGPMSINNIQENQMFIFPNPVRDGILHFSEMMSGTVFSIDGVELLRFNEQKMIEVTSFPPGLYFIREAKTGQVIKFIVT